MKYLKNGKIKLDGTIRECDLEEKLLNPSEIERLLLVILSQSSKFIIFIPSFSIITFLPLVKVEAFYREFFLFQQLLISYNIGDRLNF